MSTKAILKTIQEMRRIGSIAQAEVAVEALLELEAIEKATKALVAWHSDGQPPFDVAAARGWAIIESIAKEAP